MHTNHMEQVFPRAGMPLKTVPHQAHQRRASRRTGCAGARAIRLRQRGRSEM